MNRFVLIAAELQGDSSLTDCDISSASDASLWRYRDILPQRAYAIAQVAWAPNAVRFDPKRIAFTDTATIFMPSDNLVDVPFDLLFLSSVYIYFAALAARMGVLRQCRSHMYPTNIAQLPWNDSLTDVSPRIEELRSRVIVACSNVELGNANLLADLALMKLPSLKERLQADRNATIAWGDAFQDKDYSANVLSPTILQVSVGWRVSISDGLFDWIDLSNEELAKGLYQALKVISEREVTKSDLLNLSIPASAAENDKWNQMVERYHHDSLEAEKISAIHALDEIIAPALGLDSADLEEIWRDSTEDPFLKRIKPRYPGTVTRKQGFRTGLGAADRYQ